MEKGRTALIVLCIVLFSTAIAGRAFAAGEQSDICSPTVSDFHPEKTFKTLRDVQKIDEGVGHTFVGTLVKTKKGVQKRTFPAMVMPLRDIEPGSEVNLERVECRVRYDGKFLPFKIIVVK